MNRLSSFSTALRSSAPAFLRRHPRLIQAAAAAILVGGLSVSLTARADDDHRHRFAEPAIPVEGIVQILTFNGYQNIHSIDWKHGFYRVRAQDAAGQPVRLAVDPATGAYRAADRKEKPDGMFMPGTTAPETTAPGTATSGTALSAPSSQSGLTDHREPMARMVRMAHRLHPENLWSSGRF